MYVLETTTLGMLCTLSHSVLLLLFVIILEVLLLSISLFGCLNKLIKGSHGLMRCHKVSENLCDRS